MDKNHQGPFFRLKNLLSGNDKSGKKPGKYQYLIVVLCIGAAFMIVGNIFYKPASGTSASPPVKSGPGNAADIPVFGSKSNPANKSIADYEHQYENQLKTAIEDMLGVKDVTVVVNLDSSDKQVLETNKSTKTQTTEETDQNGGTRKIQDSSTDEQLVITKNGDQEVPIVVETKKPEIRGVLVVAKGADNIQVKQWIVEAVTRALGVPSFRVAVEPKK